MRTTVKSSHRSTGGVLPGVHRVTGQRIVLASGRHECTVFGRRHRRSVEQRVSLSVALGLARQGVPTVVRVEG